MSLWRLLCLSLLVAHGIADGSGSQLRGAGSSVSAATTASSVPGVSPDAAPSAAAARGDVGKAQEEAQAVSCACTATDECQCSRSDTARAQNDADVQLEQALLKRTREVSAWWHAQNETARLEPWSSPLVNGTMELWYGHYGHWHGHPGHWHGGYGGYGGYGCRRGGGCGCLFLLGCYCGHHGGCW